MKHIPGIDFIGGSYLNSIRSNRRLEKECKRDIEQMWLPRKHNIQLKLIIDTD